MDRQNSGVKALEIIQMMDAEERALAKAYIHQFTSRKQIRDLFDTIEKKIDVLNGDRKQVIKILKLNPANASDLFTKLHAELRTFIEQHLHHNRAFSLFQVQNAFQFYAQKQATHFVRDIVSSYQMDMRADNAIYPKEHLDWYILMKNKEVFERNTQHRPAELQPIKYIKNLDSFYWGERILAAIEEYNRHVIYNIPYITDDINEIIQHIEKKLPDQPILQIYAWTGKVITKSHPFEADTYKYYLKVLYDLPDNEYSEETIRSIAYLLTNLLGQNRSKMGSEFVTLYLELIDLMSYKNVLILNGKYILLPLFKNAVNLALSVGKTKWADQFFSSYKQYLQDEDSKKFIESCILIEKLEKEKSFDLLKEIELSSEDIYVLLDTKILILQNHLIDYAQVVDYNMSYIQSQCKRIVYFIEQHDVNIAAKSRAKKWLAYIKMIEKCKLKKDIDEIILKLEEDTDFVKRNWLIRILNNRWKTLSGKTKKMASH